MKKRLIVGLLLVSMFATLLPVAMPVTVSAADGDEGLTNSVPVQESFAALDVAVEENALEQYSIDLASEGVFTYEVDADGNVTITGYNGDSASLVIPDAIDGHAVVAIGESAFADLTALETVEIPDSVTEIGNYAFSGCAKLSDVKLSNNLQIIGSNSFAHCTALEAITIPKSLEIVSVVGYSSYYGPFEGCTSLKTITFEEGMTTIPANLFKDATSVETVVIPNTVTTIEKYAFAGCTALETVEIPDSVTGIGNYAFSGCTKLSDVKLSNNLQIIGSNSFAHCTALEAITIPKSLEIVSVVGYSSYYGPFEGCTSLKTITFEEGMTTIPAHLFKDSFIESIEVPDSVTEIGDYAFRDCSNLADVKLSVNLLTIGSYVFNGCTALEFIEIPDSVRLIGLDSFTGDIIIYGTSGSYAETWAANFGKQFITSEAAPEEGKHKEETIEGKEATCTEAGLTEGVKCSVCDEILVAQEEIPALGHASEAVAGKEATCTEAGLTEGVKCSVCDEALTAQEEIPALGHSFSEGECTICGEADPNVCNHTEETIAGKEATCTETGLTEGVKCSDCGEILTLQEEIPAKGHVSEVVEGKEATCTETGLTEGEKCSVCDEILAEQEEIAAKGHNYEDGKCTVCGESDPDYTEPAPDTKPDPGPEGKFTFLYDETSGTLIVVGDGAMPTFASGENPWASETINVLMIQEGVTSVTKEAFGWQSYQSVYLPKSLVYVEQWGFGPGSTNNLYYAGTEEEFEQIYFADAKDKETLTKNVVEFNTPVPELSCSHESEIIEGKEATCTEAGLTDGEKCYICGEVLVEQEEIAAKGHASEVVEGKEATCTETGLTDGVKCSVCGEVLTEQEEIPAKGHSFVDGECTVCGEADPDVCNHTEETIEGKEATCTETGLTEGVKCSVCGEILTAQEEIPAKGHSFSSGVCTVCGEADPDVCVHKEAIIKGKEATCTEAGLTEGVKCSVCGEILTAQEEIPAKDHSFSEGVCTICGEADPDVCVHKEAIIKGKEATCTEAGVTDGVVCFVCGEVLTAQEEIPAKGHSYSEGECTVCGEADPNYVETVVKGTCGENLTWSYEIATQTLTISGNGAMNDFSYFGGTVPWKNLVVKVLKVEEGVTYIGYDAFYRDSDLTTIYLPKSLTKISKDAFYSNYALKDVYYSGSSLEWGKVVFGGTMDSYWKKAEFHYQGGVVENPFKDVGVNDWFYNSVLWAKANGITGGKTATSFAPNDACTRAQVVQFLWAANGRPEPVTTHNPFKDVSANDWYYKAVLWAVESGITGGTSRDEFSPNKSCTRAEIVMFLYAAEKRPDVSGKNTFIDVSDNDWFMKAVLWASQNEVTGGIGNGKFGPYQTCTRSQVVQFLYKVYG